MNKNPINRFEKPTHIVSLWGVRCYFNEDTGGLCGTNWFFEMLIGPATWFHNAMSWITLFIMPDWEQPGFPLRVVEDLRDGKTNQNK